MPGDVLGRPHAGEISRHADVVPAAAVYTDRPFLLVKGCGVVISRTMTPTEIAMFSGLAQVVQRVGPSSPLRYLTEEEEEAARAPRPTGTGNSPTRAGRRRETSSFRRASTRIGPTRRPIPGIC